LVKRCAVSPQCGSEEFNSHVEIPERLALLTRCGPGRPAVRVLLLPQAEELHRTVEVSRVRARSILNILVGTSYVR